MTDILERLDQVANFKVGEVVEGFGPIEWATTLSKLCADAADEIRRLRTIANEAIDLANRTIDNSTRTFRQIKEELDGKSS